MKILALSGSPRRDGNTETLLDAVLRGTGGIGHEIERVRLCDLRIHPCIGCGGCEKTGVCVIGDDMGGLYEKIAAAQRIIVASPIYFYGITAQTKAFVDRCQALWSRKYLLRSQGGGQADPNRRGFLLSVAATKGSRVFEGAMLTMKYAFDAMGFVYAGEYLVRGVDRPGDLRGREDELKGADNFGAALVA